MKRWYLSPERSAPVRLSSNSRERGPWSERAPSSSDTSSISTWNPGALSWSQRTLLSAAVSRKRSSESCAMVPSSMTLPRALHHGV